MYVKSGIVNIKICIVTLFSKQWGLNESKD
jgi:hypothetical protein